MIAGLVGVSVGRRSVRAAAGLRLARLPSAGGGAADRRRPARRLRRACWPPEGACVGDQAAEITVPLSVLNETTELLRQQSTCTG